MAEVYIFFGSLWPCISPLWVYIWSFLFRSGASTRLRPNPQNVASEKIQATGVTDGPNVGMVFKAEEAEYICWKEPDVSFVHRKSA